jgi:hypothetical protein
MENIPNRAQTCAPPLSGSEKKKSYENGCKNRKKAGKLSLPKKLECRILARAYLITYAR